MNEWGFVLVESRCVSQGPSGSLKEQVALWEVAGFLPAPLKHRSEVVTLLDSKILAFLSKEKCSLLQALSSLLSFQLLKTK